MQSQDNQPPGNSDATLVAPRTQQGSARLILRRPDGQLTEYGLDKDEISIGRLASNDVVLTDDRSVSRRHAVIRRSNVGYVIEDQQSNNGTYVDGEKILYPFVLHNGQSIKVGSNELTFTMVSAVVRPAPEGLENQPVPPAAPEAQEPFYNPPIPQPAFDAPPQPAFNAPPQPAFNVPQPGAFPAPPAMDQPPGPFEQPPAAPAFQQPPPGPAYPPAQSFGQPPAPEQPFGQPGGAFPAPPQPGASPYAPAPGFQASPAPAASPEPGKVICQNCHQPTMANKAFCLNCGASMAAQSAPLGSASGGMNPYGAPASFGGPTAPPMAGPGSQPWPAPAPSQPQPWPPQPAGQQPPPGAQPWPQAPQGSQPVGAQPWPPQPAGQQPPPGAQPWPPQPPGAAQGWPGQPGQQPGPFGAGPQAPAPAAGPFDGTIFFPKGMRPIQPSDIKVRLAATQFGGQSSVQAGANITVRVWSAAQDAFYFAAPGITLRVPAPGAVEEGSVQITPLRPTTPGATDQLLFMVVDANNGQPLHPSPVAADVVIAYQPAPPFDGPGTLKLPI